MDLARFERLWRSLGARWRRFLAMWESKSQQEAVLSDQSGSLEAKKGPMVTQWRPQNHQDCKWGTLTWNQPGEPTPPTRVYYYILLGSEALW